MTYKFSLRTRIALTSGLVGLIVGYLCLLAAEIQSDSLEKDIMDIMLERTLDAALARGPRNEEPQFHPNIQVYGPGAPDQPDNFRALAPGRHELEHREGGDFEVLVADAPGGRYVIAYDETEAGRREQLVALSTSALVILAVILAMVLGYYWVAGLALAPLHAFAARLGELRPDGLVNTLEPDYEHTELGTVAKSFDRYQRRIVGFVERERAFTAAASHELRTSMAVIQNAAEVLRVPTVDPSRQRLAAERIEQAAQQMSTLLDALLALAREESASSRADQPVCRVDQVLAGLVAEQRPVAERAGLYLELDADDGGTLPIEPELLMVVAGNILRNAINYTETGGVTVTVRAGFIRIIDTGPGIPKGERDRVRERYYRADEHDRQSGSGLGLSIANRICEAYGWRLNIESAPSGGTSVTVWFHA